MLLIIKDKAQCNTEAIYALPTELHIKTISVPHREQEPVSYEDHAHNADQVNNGYCHNHKKHINIVL